MRARVGLAVVLIAVVGLAPASTSGHTTFRFGFNTPLQTHILALDPNYCTPTVSVWTQEIGKSGITRLRTQFESRGNYDIFGHLATFQKSNWVKGPTFPDDTLTNHQYFFLSPGTFFIKNYGDKAVWAKMIGEKPSFWARDAKIHKDLGTAICSGLIISPPQA